MTKKIIILSVFAISMLALAACEDLEAERVEDSVDDTTEVSDESAPEEATAEPAETTDDEPAVTEEDDEEADDVATPVPADNDEGEATEPDEIETDDAELEEAEGFRVGDTVRMGELVMTLHSVRWDEGSEFFGPDEGVRWLLTDIEIENEADSSTQLSSLLMFDLVDEENRTRDIAFMADTEGSLDGELGPGRSLRGDIAWEVREEQTEWELIFSPQLFGFGQAIFDIDEGDF